MTKLEPQKMSNLSLSDVVFQAANAPKPVFDWGSDSAGGAYTTLCRLHIVG